MISGLIKNLAEDRDRHSTTACQLTVRAWVWMLDANFVLLATTLNRLNPSKPDGITCSQHNLANQDFFH